MKNNGGTVGMNREVFLVRLKIAELKYKNLIVFTNYF